MIFKTEFELQCWCMEFLEQQGWAAWIEIASLGQSHDIVANKDGALLVIEAKLRANKRVIEQACNGKIFADYVAVLVPRCSNEFKERCVALDVALILPTDKALRGLPKHTKQIWTPQRDYVLSQMSNETRGLRIISNKPGEPRSPAGENYG